MTTSGHTAQPSWAVFARLLAPAPERAGGVAAAPAVAVRTMIRRFWPYARPYRAALGATLAAAAVAPAIGAAEIWLFKVLVDEVLVGGDVGAFPALAVAFVALNLAGGAFEFAEEYGSAWVGQRFLLRLRTDFFGHVLGLSPDALDRRRLGDVLTRLTSDVDAIERFVLTGPADAVAAVLQFALLLGALLWLDVPLTVVSLVVAPGFWFTARRFSRIVKDTSQERRRRAGSLATHAEQALSNVALVQSYNRNQAETRRFEAHGVEVLEAELAASRVRAAFLPLVDLVEVAGGIVVVGAGAHALGSGRLTVGGLLAFLAYLVQMYGPVRDLSRLSTTVFSAAAAAERVVELLEDRPQVRDDPRARHLRVRHGEIRFDDVSFRYSGAARPALDRVSFAVPAGTTVALVGRSGAGKSTLAKLLVRAHDPDRGAITIDGRDLRTATLWSVREAVGVLLQEALIFDGTIGENIAYARPDATDGEVRAAARAAAADGFIDAFPSGYATVVGQKGRRLSGGQRQRIAIARLLLRDTPIMVLDEPATGLDGETARALLAALGRQGRTLLVISHSAETARAADQVVLLDGGRVAGQGTHEQLVARHEGYSRLFGLPVGSAA